MALVLGTNCGFVTEAPTADPAQKTYVQTVDNKTTTFKDTTPASVSVVTEIGWWSSNVSEEATFQVGIYDHDSGNNKPNNLIGSSDGTAKGTTAGWKKVTGLNIPIDSETVYWIGLAMTDTSTNTEIDNRSGFPSEVHWNTSTTLQDPYGSAFGTKTYALALYAVVESPSTTSNPTIIGETII